VLSDVRIFQRDRAYGSGSLEERLPRHRKKFSRLVWVQGAIIHDRSSTDERVQIEVNNQNVRLQIVWAKLTTEERLTTYLHSRAGAELAVGQKPPLSEPKVRNRTISQQTA
jgi:hypothetical protein